MSCTDTNVGSTFKTYNYASLKELARELDRPIKMLIALSDQNDPFFADRPGARLNGAGWFTELWARFDIQDGVHVRRLHYLLCSTVGIALPDGSAYTNTHKNWHFLCRASADARLLDMVPAGAFVDRRAAEPIVYIPNDIGSAASSFVHSTEPDLPGAEEAPSIYYRPSEFQFPSLPSAAIIEPTVAEPFAIEIWAEKSTMKDILLPIARRYGVTLITGVGDLSITHCHALVSRVRSHSRRTRILYISDHDPGGEGMPIGVARKLEFFLRRDGAENLDIRLDPLVLTPAQIDEFNLPRMPIKDSDARKERFEERHGEGAVELDALEALRPGALRQIIESAIERYRRPPRRLRAKILRKGAAVRLGLADLEAEVRVEHAAEIDRLRSAWTETQSEIVGHQEAITAAIAECRETIAEHQDAIEEELDQWRTRAAPIWQAIADDLKARQARLCDAIEWPEETFDDDDDGAALFDSRRGYLEQITAYKAHQGKPTERTKYPMTCEACGSAFMARRSDIRTCGKRSCATKLYRARVKAEEDSA